MFSSFSEDIRHEATPIGLLCEGHHLRNHSDAAARSVRQTHVAYPVNRLWGKM